LHEKSAISFQQSAIKQKQEAQDYRPSAVRKKAATKAFADGRELMVAI